MRNLLILLTLTIGLFIPSAKAQSVKFENLTILVNSQDSYSDLWPAFSHFLFKNWPSLKEKNAHVPILFLCNHLEPKDKRITPYKIPNETSWSDSFLEMLGKVETKYVLVILEDYIFNQPINEERLKEVLDAMEKTGAVYAQVGFNPVSQELDKPVPGFSDIWFAKKHGPWRTSLQACIWRTDALQWILKPGEGIWKFEVDASLRSEGMREPFLKVTSNFPLVHHNAAHEGVLNDDVIAYIRANGIEIEPKKLPLKSERWFRVWAKHALSDLYHGYIKPFTSRTYSWIKSLFKG